MLQVFPSGGLKPARNKSWRKVSLRVKCHRGLMSDLLERLSSSCLSETVDLSSSSHSNTLMRWEFLMTMGTSSNMFSKPTLAFFRLEEQNMKMIKPHVIAGLHSINCGEAPLKFKLLVCIFTQRRTNEKKN